MPSTNILILGAGELGLSVLHSLAKSPHYSPSKQTLAVLLRPATTSSLDPSKTSQLQSLKDLGIDIVEGDLVNGTLDSLAEIFRSYDTIISCIGFTAGQGTQLKIARAVVQFAEGEGREGINLEKKRFIPWQFGVDYDAIGRGSPQDLFDEQLDVRDLLRGQDRVNWVIVSTGMFMSFVFHEGFGVVNFKEGSVRALGGWENRVTVMAVEDIGRVTGEIVLSDKYTDGLFDKCGPVFVAGDTVSYGELAGFLGRFTGREFRREVVSVEQAVEGARGDEAAGVSSALNKYRAVFGQGRGVAWDVKDTWNHRVGIPGMTLEDWAEKNLGKYAAVR